MPMCVRANTEACVISCPLRKALPSEGFSWPVSRLNRVVLPAPLGPMIASLSLSSTSKVTSLTAASPPKCTDRSRTSRSATDEPPPTCENQHAQSLRNDHDRENEQCPQD